MMKKRYHKFTEQLMFAIVMRDVTLCKELIERIIPDRKVREIRFAENPLMDALAKSISDDAETKPDSDHSSDWMTVETEKVLIPALLSKSVRFDALFEDENAWFDIEMQVDWEPELPLRIRYYHASKTITSLDSGDDYRNLKPGYVIFICLFDYVGMGEAVYRYQTMEEKLHLPLNDKQFTIIANLKCPEEKIPEKLRSFYQYVNHGEAGEDAFTQRIKEMVDRANESAEVQNMISVASDFAYIEKKLKAEIETLEAEKETLEAEKETLEAEKETLEAEKETLEAEKETLEAQKETLEAQNEKLELQKETLESQLKNEKLEVARKMKAQGIPDEVVAVVTGLEPGTVETL